MHDHDKSRLLSKLFSEELNTAEKKRLDEWLSQSEKNLALKEKMQRIWDLSINYEPSFDSDVEKGFAKFKKRIKPTRLMYAANLSHKQMKGYLDNLLDNEIIVSVEYKKSNYFVLTEKGIQFLHKFQEMKEFEKTFGL